MLTILVARYRHNTFKPSWTLIIMLTFDINIIINTEKYCLHSSLVDCFSFQTDYWGTFRTIWSYLPLVTRPPPYAIFRKIQGIFKGMFQCCWCYCIQLNTFKLNLKFWWKKSQCVDGQQLVDDEEIVRECQQKCHPVSPSVSGCKINKCDLILKYKTVYQQF